MKRSCIFSVVLVLSFAATAFAVEGDLLWAYTYGGPYYDSASSIIICSNNGELLLAGRTSYSSFGVPYIYLIKVNTEGDLIGSRAYDELPSATAECIISSSDGNYLILGETGAGAGLINFYLVKINSLGDTLWTHTYGCLWWNHPYSFIEVDDGGFLLVGGINPNFGNGYDMWLLKVNSEGDSLWSHTYGGVYNDFAYSIAPCGDGNFILAGYSGISPSLWNQMYVVKVNNEGEEIWSYDYGGGSDDRAYSIIPSGDGGFLIAGQTISNGYQMYLVKINAQGEELWAQEYGGSGDEYAKKIISSNDGNFLLAGFTTSYGEGAQVSLVKVDSQGTELWSGNYGRANDDGANSIVVASNGDIYLAGYTSINQEDVYLVKVEGSGVSVNPDILSNNPLGFSFLPCTPNPFNPTTTLTFTLPHPAKVSLEVFDLNGRNVGAHGMRPADDGVGLLGARSAPLQEVWYEAGTHTVPFDGSGQPSGIYLARLTTGEFSQTQKLVLLK